MRRALWVGAAVVTCGAWFVAADGDATTKSGGHLPVFKPVMSTHSLMKEQDRHFDAMVDLLRDKNAKKRFKRLRHEAMALAEMANINGYHKRARKHRDYREWAAQLKAQALEFAKLAKSKNVTKAKKLAGQMNKTCKACHDKYQD